MTGVQTCALPIYGQLEQIQKKYELIEPLLDEYLSLDEKRRHAHMAREQLQISERTLRRYVQHLREEGPRRLARKKRSDSGKMRVFHPRILKRAEELLEQNPSRSIPMLMRLLQADAEVAELVKGISSSTLYHYLKKAGHRLRGARGGSTSGGRTYRRFAAEYPNHLWQGDARHGIALPHRAKPGEKNMTYRFAWVDEFSRKILEARYYWDEKLPRMQDCFRRAVLRWGLPDRLYCDNGRVYISKHFLLLVSDLKIKKIHHPAYAAWCKGKIENVMKLVSLRQACVTSRFCERTLRERGLSVYILFIIPRHPLFGMLAKLCRILFECRQVIKRIDVVQAAGMDEAHVEISDVGTALGLEEQ